MHILITGANGFIGKHLVHRLLNNPGDLLVSRLSVMDLSLEQIPEHNLVHPIQGSFADADLLNKAFAEPVDLVFHLAAVPSGLAENNHALGVQVNINGTLALLEKLKEQGNCPALVFASSIAVYGKPATREVTDDTLPTPNLSYGAQKVIAETLVADYARRQWLKGCSVRLPGIVARPPEPNGAVSIFFSDLIRNLSSGKAFTCPVSEEARSWLMSVNLCVENLLHAATLDLEQCRTWTLPAMHVSMKELVTAIAETFPDKEVYSLIKYEKDSWVEDNFGSYPPLHCPRAEAAGFHHDGNVKALVLNALAVVE